jgi:hypothetical protein
MKIILTSLIVVGIVFAVSDEVISGVSEVPSSHRAVEISLPADFDFDAAQIELKQARRAGNTQRVRELSQMIRQYWLEHREMLPDPVMRGEGRNHQPERIKEDQGSNNPAPLWGNDIRIDPNDDVRDVAIASASNGDLYASSVWYDGADWHYLLHVSQDDGETWSVLWDTYTPGFSFFEPGIFVANDTLVISYLLFRQSDSYYRNWVITADLAPGWNPLYWGSPSGAFQEYSMSGLDVCTDGAIYVDQYVYATWIESEAYDTSRTMAAVSQEMDVSAWEVGPTLLDIATGDAYFTDTRIAFGSISDALVIVSDAFPNAYPVTFDRFIALWVSTDWGSSWSSYTNITPWDDHLDQFDPAIAGSHSNTNWVVLHTTADTVTGLNADIDNTYSLNDGASWTTTGWIGAHENLLADVWVDNNSTGFYGASRQDRASEEHIRYKDCPIGDPTAWTASVVVNDDLGNVLSGVYGPSVTFNEGPASEACVAWSGFTGVYSIWFDSYTGFAVEERNDAAQSIALSLTPNPSHDAAHLSYVVAREGAVHISLYDASGRLVRNLADETQAAGDYTLTLNNAELSAGVYFVRIETPTKQASAAMTIVK